MPSKKVAPPAEEIEEVTDEMLNIEGSEGDEGDEGDFFEGDDMLAMMEDEDDMMTFCEDEDAEEFNMNELFLKASKAEQKGPKTNTVPEVFQGKDYYEILGVARDATSEEINKAYKRMSLKHHPDRNLSNPNATDEFQYLAKIHETLAKDPRKRAMYDKHGDVSNDISADFVDAYEYWRQVFPGVTPSDEEAFRANYTDSEEEYTDVLNAFNEAQGDLFLMMKDILFFSTPESAERDAAMVEKLIADGKITDKTLIAKFRASVPTAGAKLKAFQEEQEQQYAALEAIAKSKAKKNGKVDDNTARQVLMQMIMEQNRTRNSDFLTSIGAKFMEQDQNMLKKAKRKSKGSDAPASKKRK